MRTTAVSWLVEVGMDFGLHQESLFLAVALLDRYLTATEVSLIVCLMHVCTDRRPAEAATRSFLILGARTAATSGAPSFLEYYQVIVNVLAWLQGVARNDLQLISVACMLVAAKHEEVSHAQYLPYRTPPSCCCILMPAGCCSTCVQSLFVTA